MHAGADRKRLRHGTPERRRVRNPFGRADAASSGATLSTRRRRATGARGRVVAEDREARAARPENLDRYWPCCGALQVVIDRRAIRRVPRLRLVLLRRRPVVASLA